MRAWWCRGGWGAGMLLRTMAEQPPYQTDAEGISDANPASLASPRPFRNNQLRGGVRTEAPQIGSQALMLSCHSP
jgi:hypothetical protein